MSGNGFLARDITIENIAGAKKHQAVALRVNEDFVALYRCHINGYQGTLYVHSFQQFYQECDILGTIDFVLGNAVVVFQGCNIWLKMPLHGQQLSQHNLVIAQMRTLEFPSRIVQF